MNTTDLAFDEIFLSRKDIRILKKSEKASVPTKECKNLLIYKFVDEIKVNNPGYLPKSTGTAQINNLGISYLAYIKAKNNDRKRDHMHDWLVAVFSTLAGAVLSKPLWEFIEWICYALAEIF